MTDEPKEITTPPASELQAETPGDFETWFKKQPQEIQDRFTAQYGKLDAALKSEREIGKANKGALDKLAKLEAAEKERQEAQLTKEQLLTKKAEEAEIKAEQAKVEASAKLLRAAVLLKAGQMDFENPADAFALAKAEKSLDAITANDAGDYDEKALETALKPLIGRLPIKQKGSGQGTPDLKLKKGIAPPTKSDFLDKKRHGYAPL